VLSVPEHRNVTAAIIGNLLEWYEFAVYGFLAAILGRLFFPADDSFSSLLVAFGVFAIGFAARPLGALPPARSGLCFSAISAGRRP
jgi:MHS family proline/betaine transporter-like MFS transporter